jgi:hypothetical protein
MYFRHALKQDLGASLLEGQYRMHFGKMIDYMNWFHPETVFFTHNAPIHWFIGSLEVNGYYREGNVSPLLSACNNWKSVFVAFLNACYSE